ncbi:carboxypeptidase [Pedobacter lusitanus]|uniref:Carboxypeptidase n=1 Tax=Pedobacter lusitanus TaxID=1503925 RepID=A0A0D0GMZ4_9SPHI|nr:carboxypeptidase [Pedobacter lusitanus]KIO77565.1 carboxypeptidase [Pedobacter lusitanus]
MKIFYTLILAGLCVCHSVNAQKMQPLKSVPETKKGDSSANNEVNSRNIVTESSVVTQHQVTIKGQRIPYKAVTGTLPVWDETGKAIAGLFYTYYERSDVKERSSRPLVISFNGGPGSASVWMHIAYTGPVLLNIDDEGYPVQPYGYTENKYSILDVADIVYIDPVNTGYSRAINKDIPGSKFFGVNADIKYLAEWINTFVTRNNRWGSPKFLIGESYGTTRVSGLALELQNSQWMYLNGVVLVSPTTLGIQRGDALSAALRLPYFAATAWYHKALKADLQQKTLSSLLPEVEQFTMNELIPALAKGSQLSDEQKKVMAAKMSAYSGITEKTILQHNLDVPADFFWKELLRDKGFTIGRLDSRYRGMDKQDAGDGPDYNAELSSWLHSFTPAINMYIRNELNYKTDLKYNMFGSVYPWDNTGNRTAENLRDAMSQNPSLHLLVQSGYFDGACDYFNAKYNLWQMDPAGKLKDRMSWEGYESGHMMYLRRADLQKGNDDLRDFIKKSLPKAGIASKF